MNLTPRRIGKFGISAELLVTVGWEKLGLVLGRTGMLVVEANYCFDTRAIEYTAVCPMFDVIPEGVSAPTYRVEIEHQDHTLSIYFRRVS